MIGMLKRHNSFMRSFWNRDKVRIIRFSIRTLLWSYLGKNQYRLVNSWGNDVDRFWITQFIEQHFSTNKKVLMCSCFDYPCRYLRFNKAIRIFFTGENLQHSIIQNRTRWYGDHRLKDVDLALGFEYKQEANYIRFPQWIWHRDFISPKATLEDIKQKISNINKLETRLNSNRTRFIAQISRHDIGGIRMKLIELFDSIGQIDCAGEFNRNTDELQTVYNDKKEDFLANYRFCICPENSLGDGYITEKVFEAIASGCIPIYWGACLEEGILNPQAILRYEKGKEKELFEQVQRLWTDENAYKEFAMQPPFLDGAAEKIWEMLENLKKKLKPLF